MHKILEKTTQKNNVKFKIEIPKEKIEEIKEKHIAKAVEAVELPGFRKGKVPRDKALEKIDMQHVLGHAINEAIQESYYKAIIDEKFSPLNQPKIDVTEFKDDGPLIYEASFDILPEIKLGDWEEIIKKSGIQKEKAEVTKAEEEKAIADLQKNLVEYNDVERACKNEDMVEIDFEGRFKDESKNNPETTTKLKSENHPLVLGSKTMIPGFEDQIVGMKKDEEKEFEIKFPEDYHANDFKSQIVIFKVKVKAIREQKLTELNDAMAQKIGMKTFAELKQKISENLAKQKEESVTRKFEDAILEHLASKIKEEMPESLINQELDYMVSDFSRHISGQGLTLEQYLDNSKKTIEDIRGDWKKSAENRIKISLIFETIANQKQIKVTEEDIKKQTEDLIKAGSISEEQSRGEEYAKYVRNVVRNKKVIKLITDLATK